MIWKTKPVFRKKLWGSKTLLTKLGFDNRHHDLIGEILVLSALPGEESAIQCLSDPDQKYSGLLSEIYQRFPNKFFCSRFSEFPLLLKFLTPSADLSIQVHPTDDYAQQHENQIFGKEESWVCLAAPINAKVIYGHNLRTKSELKINQNGLDWNKFLRYAPIKTGSVINVPPGTVHALLAGTVVYELQQNSDLTYRLYDYDRIQSDGSKRALHMPKAIENLYYPQHPDYHHLLSYTRNKLEIKIKNKHYSLFSLLIDDEFRLRGINNALIVTVLKGTCTINSHTAKEFDTFILSRKPSVINYCFKGHAKLLVATC